MARISSQWNNLSIYVNFSTAWRLLPTVHIWFYGVHHGHLEPQILLKFRAWRWALLRCKILTAEARGKIKKIHFTELGKARVIFQVNAFVAADFERPRTNIAKAWNYIMITCVCYHCVNWHTLLALMQAK